MVTSGPGGGGPELSRELFARLGGFGTLWCPHCAGQERALRVGHHLKGRGLARGAPVVAAPLCSERAGELG